MSTSSASNPFFGRSPVQVNPHVRGIGSSHRVKFVEPLERRMLLCSTVQQLMDAGVPASIIDDGGHISRADYEALSPELRAHVDPHWVEDGAGDVNPDLIYGEPLYMSEAEAHAARGAAADALPDFFPQLISSDMPFITTTKHPGRVLLAFGTQVNNQGAGPGSLISRNPGTAIPTGAPITSWVNPNGSQNVLQPVFTYTGSSYVLSHYRLAGTMTYHTGHGHFHYDGYASYALRHRNTDGTVGDYVQSPDGTGAIGAKVGFCLLTFSGTFTTEWGAASSSLPGFNEDLNAPQNCGFDQGILVGRFDRYSSSLDGQWIDVTGVPAGQYFLEIALDYEGSMLESNEDNNAKTFLVNINGNPQGTAIPADNFDTGGHNDTFDTATDMDEMGVFTRTGLTIHWGGDRDFFSFTATSGGAGTVGTSGNGDVNIYLYDGDQNLLKQSTSASATDTISWDFVKDQQYYVMVESFSSTRSNNYQVAWNIKPTIDGSTADAVAGELGEDFGTIAIARNGPVTSPLIVNISVAGTATRGEDYNFYHDGVLVTGNTVTLGNLASIANLEIRPIHDSTPEPAETVIVTLNTSAAYVIGSTDSGTVTITDAGPEVAQAAHVWQTSPNQVWIDIDRADPATVEQGDFVVTNLDTSQPVALGTFSTQDLGNGTVRATLSFDGVLPDGNYRVNVAASAFANTLGDPSALPFEFDFFQLAGDANHDGTVNLADFNILAGNFGQSSGMDASTGDFNHDGTVDLGDFNILAAKFGTGLPRTAARASAAGAFSDVKLTDQRRDERLEQLQ